MKVLVTDRFEPESFKYLKAQVGLEVFCSETPYPTENEIHDKDILIIRSRTDIDEKLLLRAPKLKFIITGTSGFDHIDLKLTQKRNIKVAFTPNANAQSAAELTWALILAAHKKLKYAFKEAEKNQWNRSELLGQELGGKHLGIIGLGRVGKKVAQIANAFNMRVFAFDPYIEDHEFAENNVQRLGLTEVLKLSEILSFHVPLTKQTQNMLNRRLYSDIHQGCLLINTSRGAVVNETDLLEGLKNGTFSGAALDVFHREPLPQSSPLRNHPLILTTPHIGATTLEAFKKASMESAQKAIAFSKGEEITDLLPLSAPWWEYKF